MLEDHVVPWMHHWRWALGLHSEQGAESIHNIFNSLERTYSTIRNPLERMRCMFREHQLQTSAQSIEFQSQVARKRTKNSE